MSTHPKIGLKNSPLLIILAWIGVFCLSTRAFSQEFGIEQFELNESGQPQFQFTSDSKFYYVLLRGAVVTEINEPISMVLGENSNLLVDTEISGPDRFYVVHGIPISMPWDTDQDGIDDVYELRSSVLNPLDPLDADLDPDMDGRTNIEEYRLGSDPSQHNQSPNVSILAPSDGSEFRLGTFVPVSVRAVDLDGEITETTLQGDGQTLISWVNPPFTFDWTGLALGEHTLVATATDDFGDIGQSSPVVFSVVENVKPLIQITNPIEDQVVTTPPEILLQAEASDPDGSISTVTFYLGDEVLGEVNKEPYELRFTPETLGKLEVRAVSVDNEGGTATSDSEVDPEIRTSG